MRNKLFRPLHQEKINEYIDKDRGLLLGSHDIRESARKELKNPSNNGNLVTFPNASFTLFKYIQASVNISSIQIQKYLHNLESSFPI
jgi:hypothetical protein